MEPKRSASEQVAFRIEPELSGRWYEFAADTLIPNRAHYACAMMLYLAADPRQRDAVQRLYARFQRSGELELSSAGAPEGQGPLSADEFELLAAYRSAAEAAREEAIANLLEQPGAASRKRSTGGTRDHRAG